MSDQQDQHDQPRDESGDDETATDRDGREGQVSETARLDETRAGGADATDKTTYLAPEHDAGEPDPSAD